MEKLIEILKLFDKDNLVIIAVTLICIYAMYYFGASGRDIVTTGLGGLLGMALGKQGT